MTGQAGDHAARQSETYEDDDPDDDGDSHRYSAAEIEQNALNIHRDSVNLVGAVSKVTLVSSVVRGVRIGGIWRRFQGGSEWFQITGWFISAARTRLRKH